MSAITHSSGTPSFMAPAPSFSFFEQAIQGQLVNFDVFDELGGGWYQYRSVQIELYAPGWIGGYDDDDVAHAVIMARKVPYQFAGVRW